MADIDLNSPRLEDFLGFKLSLISNTLLKLVGKYYAQYGLGITEARIIVFVGQSEPVSIRQITDKTCIDKAWISRSVTSLLKQELIVKHPDENDARKVKLVLSDKGKEIYQMFMQEAVERNKKLFEKLSVGQRAMFMELLTQLQERADELIIEEG